MSTPPPPGVPESNLARVYEAVSIVERELAAGRSPKLDDICADDPPGHLHAAILRRLVGGGTAAPRGYRVDAEIGQGGFGIVYRATQEAGTGPPRAVALKFPSRPAPGEIRRFLREVEAVTAVDHPNVVGVYEFGDFLGCPYLAMEYLPGGSLADRLRAPARMAPRAAAEMLWKVARGAAAVHAAGIVHRDLKPGNVLFTAAGEPKVTDFGLAKHGVSDLTRTKALLGTPWYMSPEQADGGAKFVGPPADVWALGVILYECLTGQRPFTGDRVEVVLGRITAADPVPVRRLAPDTPRPLATVVDRCLRRSADRRYPDAAALAADLGLFLTGGRVTARPVGYAERLAERIQRDPKAAAAWGFGAVAAAVVAVAVVLGVLLADSYNLRRKLKSVQEAEQYGRLVDTAFRDWRADPSGAALAGRLDAADAALRGWEWRYVSRLARPVLFGPDERNRVTGNAGGVYAVAFHPAADRVLSGHGDGSVWEWDAAARVPLRALVPGREAGGDSDRVWAVAYSPDGTRAAVTADHEVRVLDLTPGKTPDRVLAHPSTVRAVGFAPDGVRLVTACVDGTVRVWGAAGEPVVIAAHTDWVVSAAFGPNGRVVTAGWDKYAKVWDLADPTRPAAEFPHPAAVQAARLSPDGARVVTACEDGFVRVWAVETPEKETRTLRAHPAGADAAGFSPDGRRIVSAGRDGTARVWDADAGRELFALQGHDNRVWAAGFSPDGRRVVTGSLDGKLGLWEAADGGESVALRAYANTVPPTPVTAVGFVAGGAILVATAGGEVRWWDTTTWTAAAPPPGATAPDPPPATDRRGARTLVLRPDGVVEVTDTGPNGGTFVLPAAARVRAAAFDPAGERIVTGGEDRTVRVWSAATGAELLTLPRQGVAVVVVAWSPDGSRIVSGSADGAVLVWSAGRPPE